MEASEPPAEPSMLGKLRNTWEFANLMQYIFIFGKAVKIDEDFDIEVRPLCLDLQWPGMMADCCRTTKGRRLMASVCVIGP